jgi:hypothetical protein
MRGTSFDGEDYCNCVQAVMFRDALRVAYGALAEFEPDVRKAYVAVSDALHNDDGLEAAYDEMYGVKERRLTPDELRRYDDLVANEAARVLLFRREAQRQQRWRDGAQLRQVANEAARANVQLEDPVASDEEEQS